MLNLGTCKKDTLDISHSPSHILHLDILHSISHNLHSTSHTYSSHSCSSVNNIMDGLSRPMIQSHTAALLEQEGLLSKVTENRRKISAHLLMPPSSKSSRSISDSTLSISETVSSGSLGRTVSPHDFTATYISEPVDAIDIPADLQSKETYRFLGFDDDTATSLWNLFTQQDMEADFFDFVVWHFEGSEVPDVSSGEENWEVTMLDWGIDRSLRKAILLPEFADIRFTATCKFWLIDAMYMKWKALQDLEEDAQAQLARVQRARSPKAVSISTPSMDPLTGRKGGLLSVPALRLPLPQDLAANPPSPPMESSDGTLPIVGSVGLPPLDLDRHTMLWRAGFRDRHKEFYNAATGKIRVGAIRSYPGDFAGSRGLAYFTPQKEVADRYAQWAKQKTEITNVVVVKVAVPWDWIEVLQTEYLWVNHPQNMWKKLVWSSRCGDPLSEELEYLLQKDLLVGHIASGTNKKFERMSPHTQIKENDLLTVMIDGEMKKAIQWVFLIRIEQKGCSRENLRTRCGTIALGLGKFHQRLGNLLQFRLCDEHSTNASFLSPSKIRAFLLSPHLPFPSPYVSRPPNPQNPPPPRPSSQVRSCTCPARLDRRPYTLVREKWRTCRCSRQSRCRCGWRIRWLACRGRRRLWI